MNAWPFVIAYGALFARKRGLALRYLRHERREPIPSAPFAATIVQPILGGDPHLGETLEHNVIALRDAAFLWLVDEEDAEAIRVCDALAVAHAARDIRIVRCPPAAENDNPKLFKLALAERHVATEIVVVIDDDTMVGIDAFAALLDALERHDLATGLPSYVSGGDVPSALVEQFVNNNAALTYLSACAVASPLTINGMCYALRVRTLGEIGGFGAYLRWLPDDLAVARAVRAIGGSIYQTPYPHVIRTTVGDVAKYTGLMQRWFLFALLLLDNVPPKTRASILTANALPPLLLWAVLVTTAARRSRSNAAALATLLILRAFAHIDLQRRVFGRSRHRPVLSVVAELMETLHAVHALANRTIRWRSRRIVVRAADDFSVLP